MLIPEKIVNFNVYSDTVCSANKLIGITDEVTLPNFQFMSETINLAGMGGEIDSPAVGQLQSAQIKIPFTNISESMFEVAQDDASAIILRGAYEIVDSSTNGKSFRNVGIYIRGMLKEVDFGSFKKASYGNPSVTKEITFFKLAIDGDPVIEIDKWNCKYVINGTDYGKNILDLI